MVEILCGGAGHSIAVRGGQGFELLLVSWLWPTITIAIVIVIVIAIVMLRKRMVPMVTMINMESWICSYIRKLNIYRPFFCDLWRWPW